MTARPATGLDAPEASARAVGSDPPPSQRRAPKRSGVRITRATPADSLGSVPGRPPTSVGSSLPGCSCS